MVPNGWEVKPLSSITKWSSGGTPSKNNPDYWNGEIPWISAASMRGHYFEKSKLKITDLAVSNGAKMAPKDSLLLLVRGSMLWNKIPVGIAARRVSFNQDVKCLVPHADELTTEFLLYWFLAYEHHLMNMVTGTGIGAGKLDTTDLQGLDVFLPPLPEQRKIAQILSTWDRGIATTEKLIDASKRQKKALMQQLLTGKKRLIDPDTGKEFEGDWEEVRLGDFVIIQSGYAPSQFTLTKDEKYPYVKVEDMNNCTKYQNLSREYSCKTKKTVPKGSVIFPKRGAAIMNNKVRIAAKEIYMDSNMMALTPKDKLHSEFCYYLLLREELYRIADTSTIPQINNKHITPYTFLLPSKLEQQKIASVLTAADKEIELLQAKLAHFKQEKKALMQQLLTGKKRVNLAQTMEVTV
ncbi:restriction endonuclease subunit S [Photobacterium toruni]|uniref:restriction endonuclease subunit S n=1 Tax=Photobacterium toruni TaxID=1935446 RepID=UPI00210F313B|nr:restriction endonuclease subunit S [Photobacterium toruni]